MKIRRRRGRLLAWLGLAFLAMRAADAADWPALDPADIAMTVEPKAPSTPAIFLYRQVDRNDEDGTEVNTLAVKILTDEGRRYANVQIPYFASREYVGGIEARTLRPDGTVVKFDGKVYEAPLVKARDMHLMSKTFTLPEVQVGSVIEYRYRRSMNQGYVYDSQWVFSDELFTKHGVFRLTPSSAFPVRWSWPVGLPAGAQAPAAKGTRISMEVQDVPAFVTEDYMPPETSLKYRINFTYEDELQEKDPEKYWTHFAKLRYHVVDNFIDHRRAMEKAVATIIDSTDVPAIRVQKIYDRTQRVRNVTFEPERSAAERERDKIGERDDAADVWDRGYGSGEQITWLFLALLRAAGISADAVVVSTRDEYFFQKEMLNSRALNTNVVRIHVGDKELYADPGTPFAPLGMLPWTEAGVTGLVLSRDGGTWIKTPMPSEAESRLERNANFVMSENGALQGHLVVTFHGLQALTRRLSRRNEDARARAEALESEVQSYVPIGIEIKLVDGVDWNASSSTLRAEFDIRVPGFAIPAGSRMLMPASVFRAEEGRMFAHATRVHPIYFEYPFSHEDTVSITLPAGYRPTGLPDPNSHDAGAAHYRNIVDFHDGTLTERRYVDIVGNLFAVRAFAPLRDFFQTVRTGDEEQIVLSRAKAVAAP